MDRKSIISLAVGLLVGVLATGVGARYAVNNDHAGMMNMMGIRHDRSTAGGHSEMSMDEMTQRLRGLSGDDFDKAFLQMMIEHHEGAIDMAALIDQRAKHDELKEFGKAIMTVQSEEVHTMEDWMIEWGYADGVTEHMDHDQPF